MLGSESWSLTKAYEIHRAVTEMMVHKDYIGRETCKTYLLWNIQSSTVLWILLWSSIISAHVNIRSFSLQLQRSVHTLTQYRFPHILATKLQTRTGPTAGQQLLCFSFSFPEKALVWVFQEQNSHSFHMFARRQLVVSDLEIQILKRSWKRVKCDVLNTQPKWMVNSRKQYIIVGWKAEIG